MKYKIGKIIYNLFIVFIFMLAACSPIPTITPTITDTPTKTLEPITPTFTASVTSTLTPTLTKTFTPTVTKSVTPSFTSTFTLTPTKTKTLTPTFTNVPPTIIVTDCTYYISNNGNDEADGKSNVSAWATLVNLSIVKSGEKVCLEKNSNWVGRITLNGGITLSDYGEEGYPPRISNPGSSSNDAIRLRGNNNIVENIEIYDCGGNGIYVGTAQSHSSNNIIRNVEISNCGGGLRVYGEYNLIEANYIHDLHMLVNTIGGDDDYGAVGVWLFSNHNRVLNNMMVDCIAPSYDYDFDGGAVEFWASSGKDAGWNEIAYNWFERTENISEFGGSGGIAENNRIHHNVILNPNGNILSFHMPGSGFGVSSKGTAFENNTVVALDTPETEVMIYWSKAPTPEDLIFINNVVYLGPQIKRWVYGNVNNNGFYHNYNIYFSLRDGFSSNWGYSSFGNGEIVADPLFYDIFGEDFRLLPNSMGIGSGNDGLNMGAYP